MGTPIRDRIRRRRWMPTWKRRSMEQANWIGWKAVKDLTGLSA